MYPDQNLLDRVATLAHQAGAAILEVYHSSEHQVTYKEDASPLTAADLASHRAIVAGLEELEPRLPILSEEGADMPFAERRGWRRFWLVDPLDGTKEFLKRNGEFTVNIALIEDGRPVLGVVYAPVLARTYLGLVGKGAWRSDGDKAPRSIIATGSSSTELQVVASRSHPSPELEALLAQLGEHRRLSMGSSLKLCLVADAAADFYPRLGPTMEWDTAAAHAVVRAAGGEVLDLQGEALRYNKEELRNPYFVVVGQRPVGWREALAAKSA